MIPHYIQQALDRKVDEYKIHDLESKIRSAQSEIRENKEVISTLRYRVETLSEVVQNLIIALQDNQSETDNELSYTLQNLQTYLQ